MIRHCCVTMVFGLFFANTVLAEIIKADGVIKSVDAKKRTISVEIEGSSKDFEVGGKAKIRIDGKDSKLDSLKEGQSVSISYHDDLEVVVSIEVSERTKSSASSSETEPVNGEVSLFDGKTLKGWHGDPLDLESQRRCHRWQERCQIEVQHVSGVGQTISRFSIAAEVPSHRREQWRPSS